MENVINFFKSYQNAMYIFIACIVITMTGLAFNKGQYYQYNYEKQIIKDCDMGWYDTNEIICKDYKEKEKIIDDKEANSGISIPSKIPYDYIMFLSSILQITFICTAMFMVGVKYKNSKFIIMRNKENEKIHNLFKCIPTVILMIVMCCILNYVYILVNGVFSSNDFLRIIFEAAISIILIILGKKL